NFVEPQVTSEQHATANYGKSRIEKPRSETEEEELASSVETRATSPSVYSAAAQQPNQGIQSSADSKFFAIRTTGGQERVVANLLQTRANAKKLLIRSIIVLDSFKGYIIVEAPDSNVAYEALAGIRHVRGQIRGDLPFKDIEGYLVKKPVVSELSTDDTVEVIAGPFKSMKAKITRVDYEKQEATVVLLDSPYQIPVTVDANYLKRLAH
ncbi:MAG TPA: transcription elongation factor Spt5, partial [Nitrososphaera sp.]|nr:transcription elongation factor Spt5 [Nitrososphaera sp.]